MREFDLLRHVYDATAACSGRVIVGPGDDMAIVRLCGQDVLVGIDQVVDGKHVRLEVTPLEFVARKAMTRCLSDVAAMAARPSASLVAVTLPPDFGQARAEAMFDVMRATAERYACPLVGGDIAFHAGIEDPMVCTVTVLAEPAETAPVTRAGARPGDTVYVTGTLGGSLNADGLGRHLTFEPRIREALELASLLQERLHAMIDLSDGLGRDASHIAEQSEVQIRLEADLLPCTITGDWRRALQDGEDYELCFTATGPVPESIQALPITAVGEVVSPGGDDDRRVVVRDQNQELTADTLGWQHET